MKIKALGFLCLFIMCSCSLEKNFDTVDPAGYSSVVVFGASYCDNGHPRANQYSSSLRAPPYYRGRWSNGPVWVEHIASIWGIPLFNYAYGGATPNNDLTNGGVPDTRSQIKAYIADIKSEKIKRGRGKVLHLMWVGINSLFHIWNSGLGLQRAIEEAEEVKKQFILLLHDPTINTVPSEFHLLTLPPLQIVPNDLSLGIHYSHYPHELDDNGGIKGLTDAYNYHLVQAIRNLNAQSAFVHEIAGFWYGIHSSPSTYGFKYVKYPCLSSSQSCGTPGQYVYFDSLHPTTRMHSLIGDWVMRSISDYSLSKKKN